MLRPDGAHLVVRRKFTAIRLREGFVKRRFFLGAQLKHGLIFPGQLDEYAGKVVLAFQREDRGRFRRLVQAVLVMAER